MAGAVALVAMASPAFAQPAPPPAQAAALDAPAAPVHPATIARDAAGRATVRAVRLEDTVRLDGQLDEDVYQRIEPIHGFVQADPDEGEPASEPTDVWILFSDDTLYVAARCWTSLPDRLVGNEMRRDSTNIVQNDNFAVVLDTFYDHRNGFLFHTNPVGGMVDGLITDEGVFNNEWNTVWHVRTARFERGWSVEMAIPFRSLRYRSAGPQLWGINFRRVARARNELSFLTPVSRAWGTGGIAKLSLAATLVDLDIGRSSRPLEVKPYGIARVTTDRQATPARSNDWAPDIGADLKLGLTRGLTLDATVNTDFAQVEVDEQQVNLTRFSLFFPEKRDFFLEGQGIFNLAGQSDDDVDVPLVFFSRRIGLERGQTVPIVAGARLTGRAGAYSVGALSLRQDEADDALTPATTFSVARVRRDVGRRNTVGALLTHRSMDASGLGDNLAGGADATVWLAPNLVTTGYYARTENADGTGGASYRGKFNFNGDLVGAVGDYMRVDAAFDPGVGFVRRADIIRVNSSLRYSPRPVSMPAIRKFDYTASLVYFANTDWRLQNRAANVTFGITFDNGDSFQTRVAHELEHLDDGFTLADTAFIPAGNYTAKEINVIYTLGPGRRLSGEMGVQHGTFYGGTRRELDASLRLEITPRVSFEPRLNVNWLDLEFDPGRFHTTLAGSRANFTISPRMIVSTLLQYNSTANSFASNLRFHWEFTPGSDLYVVYSDQRDTELHPSLQQRSFVVKVGKLVRF
jgi:hypothetical protein